jgi:hypothetical protein
MKISEVLSVRDAKEFIRFPKELYRHDPFWVCPLDNEIDASFDPSKNHTFAHGEAKRWLLYDEKDRTIGRIAAFIDRIRSSANRQPTGGIGFFEVKNDKTAAFLLFDTAREWLSSKGMEAMDGPINFGENDTNWGLLVEGFTQPGFGMAYHKKYYKGFFEEYGFRNYFEQYSYHKDVGAVEIFPERFMKIADWISKKPGYSFHHFDFRNKDAFINDLAEVYNSTWSVFKEDFTPLEPSFLMESFNKSKAFIDEELIWFAYHNEKPVAFFILYPDLNQIIKHFNGKLSLWNMVRFIYFKKTHKMTRMRAVAAGVNPSYQNSGIESAIFLQLYKVFRKKTFYKELELSWVGDFNPKMMSMYEALGAQLAKTHITYRYYLNDKLKYIRYKDEMAENKKERLESAKSN